MDIMAYFTPIFRWWKLILAAALVAGVSTFVTLLRQDPIYQANTTLMIGQSITSPNPSSAQFYLEQELAKIYADMGVRDPVRKGTMEALGLPWLPDYTVRALPNTQLLEIIVRDTSPVRAQAVAAELANQLVQRSPANTNAEDQEQQTFIDDQLTRLQEDIQITQDELSELEVRLGDLRGARELADVEGQIAALEAKLRTLQGTYASLVAGTPRGAVNSLTVIEPAEIPTRPTGGNRFTSVVLGSALGALVATGGAYVIEFLDRRISHPSELKRLLGWPLLAEIEEMPPETSPEDYIRDNPHSSAANSFRTLRANLEMAGLGDTIKTLLITGPDVSEGKSTVAQNLAATLAVGQNRVVLIDGDFYGQQLRYSDRKGLSDILLNGGNTSECLFSPKQDKLFILGVGKNPSAAPNAMEISSLGKILDEILEVSDVIVIDGPPSFVSDSLVFAARSDGVLTVVGLNRSPWGAVARMKEVFTSAGVNILGMVVNGVSRRRSPYFVNGEFISANDKPAFARFTRRGSKKRVRRSPADQTRPEKEDEKAKKNETTAS